MTEAEVSRLFEYIDKIEATLNRMLVELNEIKSSLDRTISRMSSISRCRRPSGGTVWYLRLRTG